MRSEVSVVATILIMVIVGTTGCDSEDPVSFPDRIRIESVMPNSNLVPNTATEITVLVSFSLGSRDTGVIALGFNNGDDIHTYHIVDETKTIVSRGTGSHELTATVVVKDWGEAGAFEAFVYLAEFPHEYEFTPLDRHTTVLTFVDGSSD